MGSPEPGAHSRLLPLIDLPHGRQLRLPVAGQPVPRVGWPPVSDVAVAEPTVRHRPDVLLHAPAVSDPVPQRGEAARRVSCGPPRGPELAQRPPRLNQADDVRGRAPEVLLRAGSARVAHDQAQATALARVLVQRGVVAGVSGRRGLLVEEDALDSGVEAGPAVYVTFHRFGGAPGETGVDVADQCEALAPGLI